MKTQNIRAGWKTKIFLFVDDTQKTQNNGKVTEHKDDCDQEEKVTVVVSSRVLLL